MLSQAPMQPSSGAAASGLWPDRRGTSRRSHAAPRDKLDPNQLSLCSWC